MSNSQTNLSCIVCFHLLTAKVLCVFRPIIFYIFIFVSTISTQPEFSIKYLLRKCLLVKKESQYETLRYFYYFSNQFLYLLINPASQGICNKRRSLVPSLHHVLTSGADRNTSTNIASNVRQCVPKWAFKVRETCQVACGMISVWKQHSSNTEPESPCSSTFSLFYKKKKTQICITVHRELCPWSFFQIDF